MPAQIPEPQVVTENAAEEPLIDMDALMRSATIWLFWTYWPSAIAVPLCAIALLWAIAEYPGNHLVPGLAILLAISTAHVSWALWTTNRAGKERPYIIPHQNELRAGAPPWLSIVAAVAQIALVTLGIAISLVGISGYIDESEYPEAIWLHVAILFIVGLPLVFIVGLLISLSPCFVPVCIVRVCRHSASWLQHREATRQARKMEEGVTVAHTEQKQMQETKSLTSILAARREEGIRSHRASTPTTISTLPSYHSDDPLLEHRNAARPGRAMTVRSQSSAGWSNEREVEIIGYTV